VALSTYALVTLEDAKSFLNVVSSADDVEIERLVNAMTDLAEKETGRELKSRTHTNQTFSGTGSPLMRLKQYPIASVSAVSFLDGLDTWTSQSTTTYPVTITGGDSDSILYRNNCFPRGMANVRVTYVAGLSTIPDALKEWTLQGIAFLWKKKDRIQTGVASQSFNGQTTTYVLDLKKAIDMDLLDPYKRYAF
jgi:hypothetical protein